MDKRTSFEVDKTYEFKEIANILLNATSKVRNKMDTDLSSTTNNNPLSMLLSFDRVAFIAELMSELFNGLDI